MKLLSKMYTEVHKESIILYSTGMAVLLIIPFFPNPNIHYSSFSQFRYSLGRKAPFFQLKSQAEILAPEMLANPHRFAFQEIQLLNKTIAGKHLSLFADNSELTGSLWLFFHWLFFFSRNQN